MTIDNNKVLVQRLFDHVYNRGHLHRADEIVTAEFVCHAAPSGAPSGPAALQHLIATQRNARLDARYIAARVPARRFVMTPWIRRSGPAAPA